MSFEMAELATLEMGPFERIWRKHSPEEHARQVRQSYIEKRNEGYGHTSENAIHPDLLVFQRKKMTMTACDSTSRNQR